MSSLRRSVLVGIVLSLTSRTGLRRRAHRSVAPIKADSLTHVTIQLDAGGHNLVRAESDDKDDKDKDKPAEQKLPISVAAKLAYDERRLDRRRSERRSRRRAGRSLLRHGRSRHQSR